MRILLDGDVIAYRCGFAAEKTRYDIYHAADVEVDVIGDDGDTAYTFNPAGDGPVESFDNAKLCKAWLEVQGKVKAQHYTRVPRKEIEPVENALHSVKVVVERIRHTFAGAELTVFFSCATPQNWRTEVYPEYKANREGRKPFWYPEVRQYMEHNYDCEIGLRHEADDLIAMAAGDDTVIVSIDKDFFQIPGKHYNWVKEEIVDVDAEAALRFLAVQRIMGDSVDNIKGIPGWGESKATAHLMNSEKATLDLMVLEAYEQAFPETGMALWLATLNTAMVTLPRDASQVNDLMEDVRYAREALSAIKAAGESNAAGGEAAA